MSSKMQSPEIYNTQTAATSDDNQTEGLDISLQFSDELSEGSSYEQADIQPLQQRFQSIISDSPLCRDLEGQADIPWTERLSLPLSDFEKYDDEPPSCSAFETIVSEEISEDIHELEETRGFCFLDDGCRTTSEIHQQQDQQDFLELEGQSSLVDKVAEPQDESAYDTCLEWPTIQQEASSLNELSDFIADSCRLSKETSVLLKMLEDASSSPTVVVCVANDDNPKNILSSVQHQLTTNIGNQSLAAPRDTQPHKESPRTLLKRSREMYSLGTTNNGLRGAGLTNDTHKLLENPLVPYPSNVDFKNMIAEHANSFFEMEYEAKMERQFRRKEKNRECSRNFRYKQRIKEDCLKRGKLEKEVCLRSLLYERARLNNALEELAKNCSSCHKAMEFLSSFTNTCDKENMLTKLQEQTKQKPKAK